MNYQKLFKLQIAAGTFWFSEFRTWNGYLYYKLASSPNRQLILKIEREDDGDVHFNGEGTWLIL